jgi:hypothetical protein
MDNNDNNDNNEKDEQQEHPSKKVKLNEKEEEEEVCAICLDSSDLLPSHGCNQCTATAFSICGGCHQSCLSRLCPLCRGEYAPVIFHPYPITLAIPFIPANYPDPVERVKATVCTSFTLELIGKVKTAVWCPEASILHFVLPIPAEKERKASDSILASIKMNHDQFVNNRFHFTNAIWDLLEQKAIDEEGLEDEDDSVDTEGDGPDGEHNPDEPIYCTCKRVEYGYMVNCTKPDCPIKWFHFRCVGLSRATTPTSAWYCSTCIKETEGGNQTNVDQEPTLKIVREEQKQAEDNVNEVLNESLNNSTELRQEGDNNNPAAPDLLDTSEFSSIPDDILDALEFSQASIPDSRKWLVSKLLQPTAIFMTEMADTEVQEILSEIIPQGSFQR